MNDQALLKEVSKTCFMPLIWGGGISSVSEVRETLRNGADKVSINSAAIDNPSLIREASGKFGSQAVVVSIDSKCNEDGNTKYTGTGGGENRYVSTGLGERNGISGRG